jgi:hypothetical protein
MKCFTSFSVGEGGHYGYHRQHAAYGRHYAREKQLIAKKEKKLIDLAADPGQQHLDMIDEVLFTLFSLFLSKYFVVLNRVLISSVLIRRKVVL